WSRFLFPGDQRRLSVLALNPVTRAPVRGVEVEAIEDSDSASAARFQAVTGADGHATLELPAPVPTADEDGEETVEADVKITARRGPVERHATAEFRLRRDARILVQTDKPMYQPGQVVHGRVLVFGVDGKALEGKEITFRVSDPEYTDVLVERATTNRFGIAAVDWNLADNLRLGDYRLRADLGDDDHDSQGQTSVRVSRYDLPNFSVSASPNRPYYLPGENAEVEIRAGYLFGRPVKKGAVRVVREEEREWDYRQQKYIVKEAAVYTGELDSQGVYVAKVDLEDAHARLDPDSRSRFLDAEYVAYVTDASTARTEPTRFSLRVSHEPIHVYLIENGGFRPGGEATIYVSTFYADGSPALCDVEVSTQARRGVGKDGFGPELLLRNARTNTYGLAKINLALPSTSKKDDSVLIVRARDQQGRRGEYGEDIWFSDHPRLWLSADRALYRPGEPVLLSLRGSREVRRATVEVRRDGKLIGARNVRLRKGGGFLAFPYKARFQGEITFVAYSPDGSSGSRYDLPMGAHSVLYPQARDLKVSVKLRPGANRPGDEVTAEIAVQEPEGRRTPAAVGIVVVDRAVEERARTDLRFSAGFLSPLASRDSSEKFGNLSRRDLDALSPAGPFPDDLQLAAEVLLRSPSGYPGLEVEDGGYSHTTEELFRQTFQSQFQGLRNALLAMTAKGLFPGSEPEMRRLLKEVKSPLELDSLLDPWNTRYRLEFGVSYRTRRVQAISAGPDKTFGSEDDVATDSYEWEYFRPIGEAIDRAVKEAHARSGAFVRDRKTLRDELQRAGVDFDALRDPWGRPYAFEFGVREQWFTLNARSAGPDGGPAESGFPVWTSLVDYFSEARKKIERVLLDQERATGHFPESELELDSTLAPLGFRLQDLRDPWGNPYYATFRRLLETRMRAEGLTLRYDANLRTYGVPHASYANYVFISSPGADGQRGTPDDFNVARFAQPIALGSGSMLTPQPAASARTGKEMPGEIWGTIFDPAGAVIAFARIEVQDEEGGVPVKAQANSQGDYIVKALPPGRYRLRVEVAGFMGITIADVPVQAGARTEVNLVMQVGGSREVIEVSASPPLVNTTDSALAARARFRGSPAPGYSLPEQHFTPRLREYFPETLVWQPSLEIDARGRARLKFKLADNITTWKLSALVSTITGEMGGAELEIPALQPFFVEHDPPKVLTQGDEIALPVVLRNYLNRRQSVEVSLRPEKWFALTATSSVKVDVEPGDSAQAVFSFRALDTVE
ncbi:MAG: MG2 domain-containing protein, partial [Terriglobales bacterium]